VKLQKEKQNYDVIGRDYNEWLDLKGQFKALLVKSDMLRARGLLVDNSLDEIINNTNAALHANPVNMDNCRALVKRFMSSL
jgi:predicted oxidoreductase